MKTIARNATRKIAAIKGAVLKVTAHNITMGRDGTPSTQDAAWELLASTPAARLRDNEDGTYLIEATPNGNWYVLDTRTPDDIAAEDAKKRNMLYAGRGEWVHMLGSGVVNGKTGVWLNRVGNHESLAGFVDEDLLNRMFSAKTPEQAHADKLATLDQDVRVALAQMTGPRTQAVLAAEPADGEMWGQHADVTAALVRVGVLTAGHTLYLNDLGWRVRVALGGSARPAQVGQTAPEVVEPAPRSPAEHIGSSAPAPVADPVDETATTRPDADGSVATAGDSPRNDDITPRDVLNALTRRARRALKGSLTKPSARAAHTELTSHGVITRSGRTVELTRLGRLVAALARGTATAY